MNQYQDVILLKNKKFKCSNEYLKKKYRSKDVNSVMLDISDEIWGEVYDRVTFKSYKRWQTKIEKVVVKYTFTRGYIEDIYEDEEDMFIKEYKLEFETFNDFFSFVNKIILTEDILNEHIWMSASDYGYFFQFEKVKVFFKGNKNPKKMILPDFYQYLGVGRIKGIKDEVLLKTNKYDESEYIAIDNIKEYRDSVFVRFKYALYAKLNPDVYLRLRDIDYIKHHFIVLLSDGSIEFNKDITTNVSKLQEEELLLHYDKVKLHDYKDILSYLLSYILRNSVMKFCYKEEYEIGMMTVINKKFKVKFEGRKEKKYTYGELMDIIFS